MTRTMLLTLTAAVACGMSTADTIHLKTGVRVDGQVLERSETGLRIRVGNRESFFPHDSVARIEENDKTGGIDIERLRREAEARLRQKELETGLTADQRRQVEETIAMLGSDSTAQQGVALERLRNMNERLPIFRYLADDLTELMPWHAVGVMGVLVKLDPEAAAEVLRTQVRRDSGMCRAKALELLGVCGHYKSTNYMVRGLVDHDDQVRVAAARALGRLGVKSATPPLLEALSSGDQRARLAAREALEQIWAADNASFADAAGWESFWISKRASTPSPYGGESIEPLVPPGTYFQNE